MTAKRLYVTGVLLVVLIIHLAPGLWAQGAPLRINFQGRLTDSSNQPITQTTNAVISLYRGGSAQDSPGVLLYRESANLQPDNSGVFNYLIGTGAALDGSVLEAADFNTSETIYLEVSIGGAAQLPRQQVVSVPYAIQAGTLGGLTSADFVALSGGQISVERARLNNPASTDGLQVTMSGATNSSAAASLVNLSSNAASRGLSVTSAGGKGITISSQGNNAVQATSSGTTPDAGTLDATNSTATTGTALRARMTGAGNTGAALVVENSSANATAVGAGVTSAAGTALRLQSTTGSGMVVTGAPVSPTTSLVDVDAGGTQSSTGLSVRNSGAGNSGMALKVQNQSNAGAARGIRVDTAAGTGLEVVSTTGSSLAASNTGTTNPTLVVTQAGTADQPAILAQNTGLNTGATARFSNAAISGSASAVFGELTGANNSGSTARFLNLSANAAGRALYVESGAGNGMELRSSGGNKAAELKNNSTSDVQATLVLQNTGTGDLLRAYAGGTFDQVSSAALRFRVTNAGNVSASGSITPAGADFAEMLEVRGPMAAYSAGDVLVISSSGDLNVEKSNEPYSTAVVGVYSTRPGVIGEHPMLRPSGNKVPVALVGIVPCRVSAENGPIRPGDLLVTGSLTGHAMRGTDPGRMQGAVIGKALQALASGTGVIQVLVSLQ